MPNAIRLKLSRPQLYLLLFKTQTGNAKHYLITTARVTFLQLYDACVMLEQEEEKKNVSEHRMRRGV